MFSTVHLRRSSCLFDVSVLAAASALLLVGCTAVPVLTPIATPPQPGPTAVPAVEGATSPVAFVDISCADVISEAELYAALGVTVTPAPRALAGWDGMIHPSSFALESLGGLECRWTNGQPREFQSDRGTESNPNFVEVALQALPNATEEWKLYEDYYSASVPTALACYRSYEQSLLVCSAEVLADGTWVSFTLLGPPVITDDELTVATEGARLPWEAALARIAAAPPPSTTYVAPADILSLDFSCAQFVTREEAQRVLATVDPPYLDGSDGGWSLQYSSQRVAHAFGCYWITGDAVGPPEGGYGAVGVANHYLAGGEWAFERMRTASADSYQEVEIAGLAPSDSAYLECARVETCTLHLVIGHNWITFSRIEADAPGAVAVGRQTLVRLGELTAARLRG